MNPPPVTPAEGDAKNVATLRAKLALAGWRLYAIYDHDGERYLVSKWGRVHELPDLSAVVAFVAQVGGVRI